MQLIEIAMKCFLAEVNWIHFCLPVSLPWTWVYIGSHSTPWLDFLLSSSWELDNEKLNSTATLWIDWLILTIFLIYGMAKPWSELFIGYTSSIRLSVHAETNNGKKSKNFNGQQQVPLLGNACDLCTYINTTQGYSGFMEDLSRNIFMIDTIPPSFFETSDNEWYADRNTCKYWIWQVDATFTIGWHLCPTLLWFFLDLMIFSTYETR